MLQPYRTAAKYLQTFQTALVLAIVLAVAIALAPSGAVAAQGAWRNFNVCLVTTNPTNQDIAFGFAHLYWDQSGGGYVPPVATPLYSLILPAGHTNYTQITARGIPDFGPWGLGFIAFDGTLWEQFINPALVLDFRYDTNCPNMATDWSGNSISPTFDGRLNADDPGAPFIAYCAQNGLGIFSATGVPTAGVSLAAVQAIPVTGGTLDMGNGWTVGRHGDALTIAPPGSTNVDDPARIQTTLTECLAANGS